MQASEKGLAFVAAREACVLTAHRDTKLLAIGFGQNDPNLKEGDTITFEEAIALFVKSSAYYEADINKVFSDVPLSQQIFDALFAVCYNIGGTQLRKEVALIDAVKAYCSAPADLPDIRFLRDWAAYHLIRVKFSEETGAFNLSRRCREALIFIGADYGDLSTLKFWPVGKNPRHVPPDPPDLIPMPKFRA